MTEQENIEKKEREVLFFTYGTLKRGYGNYGHYLKNRSEFLGEFTTEPKYKMFDGPFPIVERNGTTAIVGELHKTNNIDAINGVFRLEGCSSQKQGDSRNWYDFDIINTPYGEAVIFVMDKNTFGEQKEIKSGKWN